MAQNLKSFFTELRRRRVLRTAALYVACAWVLVQVADTVFPIYFEAADIYMRYVTIGLFTGFPVMLVLSWIFDFDLGKIMRTDSVHIPAEQPDTPTRETEYTLSGTAIPPRSIAVMPFANVGNDPENEFFSDGIAEELLNLLSTTTDLKVAARTSSFAFKNTRDDVREIAQRLGVRNVLEGSVRRAADRVRISAQLVDAQSGYQLWSSQYDRQMVNIFAVQDDISTAIVFALKAALEETHVGAIAREKTPTDNIEAYQLYLRGMYLWQRRGETAINGAITALTEAVAADPQFVEAIALLAIATAVLHEYSGHDREHDFAQAEPLALRAMELAPELGKPHAVLGYIEMRRWNWTEAEEHFEAALQLEPNEPLVHQWYSNLLNDLGRRDAALSHALTAYNIDRLSPQANNILALNFILLGNDTEASKHISVAREFGLGGFVPDLVDCFIHLRNERFDEAAAVLTKLARSQAGNADWVQPVVDALEDGSLNAHAVAALEKALKDKHIPDSTAFLQYILLAQSEQVFALANTKLEDHSLTHLWLLLPEAASVRRNQRFLTLMDQMGILNYWNQNGWPPIVAGLKQQ